MFVKRTLSGGEKNTDPCMWRLNVKKSDFVYEESVRRRLQGRIGQTFDAIYIKIKICPPSIFGGLVVMISACQLI